MTNSKTKNTDHNLSVSVGENENFEKLLRQNNIDPQVFNLIKKMQQIPDNVIINFLNAESSLVRSNFKRNKFD